LIEGIMMRGPHKIATAVRKPDGEITIRTQNINPVFKSKVLKLPIIRGSFALIEAMLVGVKEMLLTKSSEKYLRGRQTRLSFIFR